MKSKKEKRIDASEKKVYRFQLIDIHSYDVKWVMELTKANVFIFITSLFSIFFIISSFIFAFTPLKYLLPGYVGISAQQKKEIINLKLKADSLENKVDVYARYYKNWQAFLQDSIILHSDIIVEDSITLAERSGDFPQKGKEEMQFLKDFELLYQLDDNSKVSENAFILSQLSLPFEGKVVPVESSEIDSKTLKVKTIPDSDVHAIYGGVVVNETVVKGQSIVYLQHTNGFVSIYRYSGEILVKKSEIVEKGQLIGITDSKDSQQIATFELWSEGEQIAAGKYLNY